MYYVPDYDYYNFDDIIIKAKVNQQIHTIP